MRLEHLKFTETIKKSLALKLGLKELYCGGQIIKNEISRICTKFKNPLK